MTRTTADIDPGVLRELKLKAQREGKSLGTVISEIAASALKGEPTTPADRPAWICRPMHGRVDLADKEALHAALDEPG